ncbi:MAG TPA: glycosyltransferase family 39 protein [Anaerolineae bacterium]|nr:glycosyltransferase family 39 protein [Anaerolineae bacterium]
MKKNIQISEQVRFILLIIGVGALLRLFNLDSASFWTDEIYTWRLAPELKLLSEGVPDDQHPPLYYLLFHYLMRVDDSETWLRLPSAIAGILTIPLIWLTGRTINQPRWGLITAALFALAPLFVWYGREARMYGPVTLFWGASLLFYARLLYGDNWLDVVGFGVATLLGLLTAYPTLALWGLELSFFWVLWHGNGRSLTRLGRWLLAQIIIVVGLSQWWPYMQIQLGRGGVFNWPILPAIGIDLTNDLRGILMVAGAGGATIFGAGILLWLLIWWQPRLLTVGQRLLPVVSGLLIIGFVAVTIGGAIPYGLSIRRQLLVFVFPFLFMVGGAIVYWERPLLTKSLLILTGVAALVPVFGPSFEDWRGARDYIVAAAEAGDEIIMTPAWIVQSFDYYEQPELPPYRGSDLAAYAQGAPGHQAGERIWLVYLDHPTNRPASQAAIDWFAANGTVLNRVDFPRNIVVIEYEIR